MSKQPHFPGLDASNYTTAPTHGTITHVAIHPGTGCVTAIGLDNEKLDVNLGQIHPIPEGVTPEIGKPIAGLDILRNPIDGQPV